MLLILTTKDIISLVRLKDGLMDFSYGRFKLKFDGSRTYNISASSWVVVDSN